MDVKASQEIKFVTELDKLSARDTKSVLFRKNEYFSLIQELKDAASLVTVKSNRQYYILNK